MLRGFAAACSVPAGRMLSWACVIQALVREATGEARVALELDQKCQSRGCGQTKESQEV